MAAANYIASRLSSLLISGRNIIDVIKCETLDTEYDVEVKCYASYDCEDDDDLDSMFQAIIDTLCVEVATEKNLNVTLQMFLPGSVNPDDIYDMGDRAYVSYDPIGKTIDVQVIRESGKMLEYHHHVT